MSFISSQPPAIIVQARCTSRRLPEKVLQPLSGRPMLAALLQRLRRCRSAGPPVVATSSLASDDPVAELAAREGVPCFRGSLDNVAERMFQAADSVGAAAFVRVTGDSPLLDPTLIDIASTLFQAMNCDLVSNTLVRTFPKGQSVEVIRTEALRASLPQMSQDEQEHVTLRFYRNPQAYRLINFTSGGAWADLQLSVDEPEDLDAARRLAQAEAEAGHPLGWEELAKLRRDFAP
jgi:spore coat polysaccharide biosynthesis protein SpsF